MSARSWVQFGAVSLLWGVVYLLIKVAGEDLSAATLTFARAVLAAAVLLPLAARRGVLRPLRKRLGAITVLAVLDVAAPFVLVAVGERHVSSSLAGMLIATVPILVALLAIRFDASERVGGTRVVGLLVGIVGVGLVLGVQVAGDTDAIVGAGMVLLASLLYAIASLYYKREFAGEDALGVTTWVFVVSAALLAVPAVVTAPSEVPGAGTLAATAALGIACTAVVFVLWYSLIAEIGAGRATVVTYVNPAIAVILGALLLDEPLSGGGIAGLLLIVAGSWLSTGGNVPPRLLRGRRRRAERPPVRGPERGDVVAPARA
jgi:drug/metabolite transporter (DMT)-like permease